jgi:class 3 adenylate cyclase
MFCDLVGSTELATRLDPEDLREVIGAYHKCVAEMVNRCGGFVAKYMGDGVLVYFGYPHAHEDDAERAIRAGLAIVKAVGEPSLVQDYLPQVRIGIATGLAVVGDLIGSGAAQELAVVGEMPNLAARLQVLAAPNTILIADTTHRLVGGIFDVADLGAVAMKGFGNPMQAWRVLGESTLQSRFEALRTNLTPLIGREEEIDLLLRRWQQAKSGEGRVVLLSGEPGMGKSRITATLQERLRDEPHIWLRYFSSPHHTDSALQPVISQLEHAAGFERENNAEEKLDKVGALLGRTRTSTEDIALISELLSLPSTDLYPPVLLSPQRRREKTREALLRQLEALSRQRPVLMFWEDLHWIDPTSRELLESTVERLQTLRVLLILTFRPEFAPPGMGSHM